MLTVLQWKHVLLIAVKTHAYWEILAKLAKLVLWKIHCLLELWLVSVPMAFILVTTENVFKVQSLALYFAPFFALQFSFFQTVTGVSQCQVHFDCRNTEQCHSGSCIDACRVEQCGTNAICTSRDHTISCECPTGYTGDPRVACYPSEYFNARLLPWLCL